VAAPSEVGGVAAPSPAGADAGAAGPGNEGPKLALKIDCTAVEGVKLDVSVLSEAEASLFNVRSKEGEPLSLRNVGVRATDRMLYVVVKSSWPQGATAKRQYNASASAPYTLTVAQEEAGANAEYEPNDESAKATPLPANGFREGFLSPKTDVDYYLLQTGEPVLAKVQLSGVERLDLTLSIIKPGESGAAEQVLLKVNDGAVKEPELVNNVFCPAECWFKVESALRKVDGKLVRDFENPDVAYRLSVQTVADNGAEEREPNNAADLATPIALGKPVRGTIHPKKDTDLYRLDLSGRPVKTAIKATVTGILKVDVGLYLHRVGEDGKLELVQTADRAKGEAPEVIRFTAEPGVYVLEVKDTKKASDSNFQDAYQLTVEEAE
jgi:hypothetical protein